MKNNSVHSKPGSLFGQCDYRQILEVSRPKGRYVSDGKSILYWFKTKPDTETSVQRTLGAFFMKIIKGMQEK